MSDVLKRIDDWWSNEGPDAPEEWNFSSIPDAEIIACCVWEYARESHTIHRHAGLHWCHVRDIWHREEYAKDAALKARHDEDEKRILACAERAGFDYAAFAEELWKTDFPLIYIYDSVLDLVRDEALPWQKLPREARAALSGQTEKRQHLNPIELSTVGELEKLWDNNSAELMEIRRQKRSPNDDGEDAALWDRTVVIETFPTEEGFLKGRYGAAFAIDFSRFTDVEIVEGFTSWLKENRPRQWKVPSRISPGARQKGRKLIEYRVAVERLGLMRLLHWHTPREIRKELPIAWQLIRAKERSFRREVREASKFFRKLFPFLPRDERPASEERNGVWSPPIQRMLDRMDAEKARART
ncbi:MAG: hypothetical protein H0U23_15050 [Blastocatellia bacterium]|nr:hypothetical protein [Blastocatellia bacterium]